MILLILINNKNNISRYVNYGYTQINILMNLFNNTDNKSHGNTYMS